MTKTILITGATDGIGLETAKMLAEKGHRLVLHGRNPEKLESVKAQISALSQGDAPQTFVADFADLAQVKDLAKAVAAQFERIDVLINNAGVLDKAGGNNAGGLDIHFVVNTLAPYLLTLDLMPLLGASGRVVNLSSAAQSDVDIAVLNGQSPAPSAMNAYAQSKLAITMWTRTMAARRSGDEPLFVAVNPGSLLASKMVKQGFGVAGNDISIGSTILTQAALSDEFSNANGLYFDNDNGVFADPHPDALDESKSQTVEAAIRKILADKGLLEAG